MKDSVPEGSFGDYVSVMQTPETRAGFQYGDTTWPRYFPPRYGRLPLTGVKREPALARAVARNQWVDNNPWKTALINAGTYGAFGTAATSPWWGPWIFGGGGGEKTQGGGTFVPVSIDQFVYLFD